jgi:hypothetical protein
MRNRFSRFSLAIIIALILALQLSFASATTGSITLDSGAVYTGSIELHNVPNGSGVAEWPDGSKYSGTFFNGMLNGSGTFYYVNGDVYTGEFEYGFRSGQGEMTFANGDIYKGQWKADMMHGQGKYTFLTPDPAYPKKNDTYTGQWRYNMMYGKGVYQFANGKTVKGYWIENKYYEGKLTSEMKQKIGALE